MRYSVGSACACINFMGHEFEAEIEYCVTDPGGKAIIDYNNGGDSGWGPEWDIENIYLREDKGWGDLGPTFEATGKLFSVLANSTKINDAVMNDIVSWDYE